MAVIGWSEYSCPHCGRKFSDDDIISAHFARRCPGCALAVEIDGEQALAKTQAGAFIAVGVIAVWVLGWWAALHFLGVEDTALNVRSLEQLQTFGGVLRVSFLAGLVALGVTIALRSVKAYSRARLDHRRPRPDLPCCPRCAASYDVRDYRNDAPVIYCTACGAELRR